VSARTPTTAPVITPSTVEEWQEIANTLAAEVTRLHAEIDRLKGGASVEPLTSNADWTHPLYAEWVMHGWDNIEKLHDAWHAVILGHCPVCGERLRPGPYAPFKTCDCGLCFAASDRHFLFDTVERAMDLGPDA
jgi:hypothetical protein